MTVNVHSFHEFLNIQIFSLVSTRGVDHVAERDPEAVRRFVEQFASAMVEAGLPRMPARVFAALFASDSGRMTAADLAETLQVSPAAISGAVRYMIPVNLVRREREPGSRRDVYVVDSDTWYEATLHRDQALARWQSSVEEGVKILGPDTPAGARMEETLTFFRFLRQQLPRLLEEWRKIRSEIRG
jgi:DNA-binding transcriptional regulator GbsR (MarR family)